MNESILENIKSKLPIPSDETDYDKDLVDFINSVFFILWQLGVGPSECFSIKDETALWSDFTTASNLEAVKSYIYLKVQLEFDPPSSSTLTSVKERLINELEWRLNVEVDPGSEQEE